MTRQDQTKTQGTHLTYSSAVAAVVVVIVALRKVVFERQCFAVEVFASAVPLVQP